MRLRSVLSITSILAVSTSVLAAMPAGDFVGSASTFSIDKKTQVPGETLKPGEYKIQVLDQLSDRMIVRVDSSTTKDHAIFLAVPSTSIPSGTGVGVVNWDAKLNGAAALRGFSFGPNTTVEFVYPKADAVALAKQNTARVVAVDPQSEGRPTLKNLSKDDLQVVNLWMLSLTTTGVNNKTPAILARKFTPDSGTDQTVVARTRPAPVPAPVSTPATTQIASVNHDQADQIWDAPSVRRTRPMMAKLPKTGSDLPLIWMVGLMSLVGAAGVRFGRMAREG